MEKSQCVDERLEDGAGYEAGKPCLNISKLLLSKRIVP